MHLKPTTAQAFIAHNYFVGNAPTDEFVRERLAREFAMEILKLADFERVDTPEGAHVKASLYLFDKKSINNLLKRYFEMGYQLSNDEHANNPQ